MRKEYKTDSKSAVIEFMKRNSDRHFTVEEIICEMERDGLEPSKSTVYRHVARLTKDSILKRFECEGKDSFVYQYADFQCDCQMHFHLKCIKCGKLIHMECEKMNGIKEHILSDHGFLIGGDAMINGVCLDCSNTREASR